MNKIKQLLLGLKDMQIAMLLLVLCWLTITAFLVVLTIAKIEYNRLENISYKHFLAIEAMNRGIKGSEVASILDEAYKKYKISQGLIE